MDLHSFNPLTDGNISLLGGGGGDDDDEKVHCIRRVWGGYRRWCRRARVQHRS